MSASGRKHRSLGGHGNSPCLNLSTRLWVWENNKHRRQLDYNTTVSLPHLVMVLGAISSLVSMGIRTRALVQFVEVVDSFHKFNIVYSVYF